MPTGPPPANNNHAAAEDDLMALIAEAATSVGGNRPPPTSPPAVGSRDSGESSAAAAETARAGSAAKRTLHTTRRTAYGPWLFRGRHGGSNRTPEDCRKSAVSDGRVSGHSDATSPEDVKAAVTRNAASAIERGASFAREATTNMAAAAKKFTGACATLKIVGPRLRKKERERDEAVQAKEDTEKQIAELDGKVTPRKPPARTHEEIATAAAAKGKVSKSLIRNLLLAGVTGGIVEMGFAGGFTSDAGALGFPMLGEWNLLIPFIVGFALGMVIVVGAVVAGRVANRVEEPGNPASAPWWRSRIVEIWIGAVGSFALLRGLYSLVEDGFASGALGFAVGAIMLGIAIVSAGGAGEHDKQQNTIDKAQALSPIQDEERQNKTEDPSEEEKQRDALKRYLLVLTERVDRLTQECGTLRSQYDAAMVAKAEAEVEMQAIETSSSFDAEQGKGLAVQCNYLWQRESDLVRASYRKTTPDRSNRDASPLRFEVAGLGEVPRVKVTDVLTDAARAAAEKGVSEAYAAEDIDENNDTKETS